MQCPGINDYGKEYKKECKLLESLCLQQELTQHCKSTTFWIIIITKT